mgnify:CR=1 FL=1
MRIRAGVALERDDEWLWTLTTCALVCADLGDRRVDQVDPDFGPLITIEDIRVVLLRSEDLARIHGSNERIAVSAYADMVRWYLQLLREGA